MAEMPASEPVPLAASRLTLAALAPPGPLEPWVPALAMLALEVQPASAGPLTGPSGEALAYLQRLTSPPHGLKYVSIDELVGTVAGLAIDPWPGVDQRGRLVFDGDEPVGSLEVDVDLLQRFVGAHRRWSAERGLTPADLIDEPLRIGDVFGIALGPATGAGRRADAWLDERGTGLPALDVRAPHRPKTVVALGGLAFDDHTGAIVDLAWDARELAKAAYYAAMAAELDSGRRADRPVLQAAAHAALGRLASAMEEPTDGRT